MKQEFQYYTLPQAAKELDCDTDLLVHYIETQKIEAALFATMGDYIVVRSNPSTGSLQGLGTVSYRGLIRPHQSWIRSLLEQKEIILNKWSSPLPPFEFISFSTKLPFKNKGLPPYIEDWITTDQPEFTNPDFLLYPLPEQGTHVHSLIKDFTLLLIKEEAEKENYLEKFSNVTKYAYNFSKNGKFSIDDIRLTKETIQKLKKPSEAFPWCESNGSSIGIDRIIERLYRTEGELPAKKLYRKLLDDHEDDDYHFDPEHLIVVMDYDSIEWKTSSNRQKELKYGTFANKVSKLKLFYKELGIQVSGILSS